MIRHAALATVLFAGPSLAWAQADMMAQARAAASNQVGVLEYCNAKGFSAQDAVTAQRKAVARMPGGGTAGDAEELGRAGTMLAGTERMSLTDVAARQHVDVSALCRQMADAAMRTSAMLEQNGMAAGGIPGLPAMSGMPTVPGMAALPGGTPMPGVAPAR